MKTLGCIAVILAVAAAGVAEAKSPPRRHAAAHRRTPLRHSSRHVLVDRFGVAHRYSDAAWSQMQSRSAGGPQLADVDQSSTPRLGLDVKDGKADARLGVYKRPDAPNAFPTLYKGAGATAGVSVKFGGSGSP